MRAHFASWKIDSWWKWGVIGLWGLVMVTLPMTSFPLLTQLTGAMVAPFSALPLAALVVVWFIPFIMHKGKLPVETTPLIFFVFFVVALSALSFFQSYVTYKDKTMLDQTIRSYIPFGLGMAFYFVTSAFAKNMSWLKRTLQFIHLGGALMLAWALAIEVIINLLHQPLPEFMNAIRSALVTQGSFLDSGRLPGLTLEPSWFGHQLDILYIPLWLSATYLRTSVFPRFWKLSVENLFLVLGLAAFYLTSPRISLLALFLVLVFIFLKFNLAIYRWISGYIRNHWVGFAKHPRLLNTGLGTLLVVIFVGIYGGFSYGVVKVASTRDWRLGLVVNSSISSLGINSLSDLNENTLMNIGKQFAFLERTAYWMTGWGIFNDYPILGVGLGNSGFYFADRMPPIGYSTPEIRTVLYRSTTLPNIKSFWYRLLAETGIVGFSIFVVWLLVTWFSTSCTIRSRDGTIKTLALAAQLAILAFIFEGFSVDTFGLPYIWIMTGLAAAAGLIYRRQLAQSQAES